MDTIEMERPQYHYYAFISYSSADGKWAKWLQNHLENYRLPTAVRKQSIDIPKRLMPIFRDSTDLSTGVLKDVLRKELEASKFLVVLCSPSSAASSWVNEEVKHFIELGRTERIIPLVIEGEPFSTDPKKEAFPPVLREMEQELIGISVAKYGRWDAFLRVVASLLGVRYDQLAMRDKKRTRARKIIAAAVGLTAAVGLACGVWYNAPHSQYYSAYAYRNEIPYGIHELTKHQREGLNYSYKITTQRGKVVRLECVNGLDTVTNPPLKFPIAESPRIEFSYDERGKLIKVESYDTRNTQVSAETLTYDNSNSRIAIDFRSNSDSIDAFAMAADLSYSGGTSGDTKSAITRQINTYNEEGFLIKSEFMRDNLGTRACDSNGVYGKLYEYNELGQMIRISNLDYNGAVYNCKYGWATIELEYDERGNIIAEQTYDAQGNLTRNETAVVRVEYEYDEIGNLQFNSAYDESGVLTEDKNGIAQRGFLYDENGFLNVIYYGGADDIMTANENGVCAEQYIYDDLGRLTGRICLDETLQPTDSDVLGYSANYFHLDEKGRVLQGDYYDKDFAPVLDPSLGSFSYIYEINEEDLIIGCTYYDTDMNPAINAQGYAAWRKEVDDRGYDTRVEFLDEAGSLIYCDDLGCAACEYDYDPFGNPLVQRFYDENNELIAIWEMQYENGNLIWLKYFDAAHHPCLGDEGYCEGRMEYDAKGNMIRISFYDVDGSLVNTDSGFAVGESEYDVYGNLTCQRVYDENMDPAYIPAWKVEKTYDSRNCLIREERFGKDKASTEITVYAYGDNDRLWGYSTYNGCGAMLRTEGEVVELF